MEKRTKSYTSFQLMKDAELELENLIRESKWQNIVSLKKAIIEYRSNKNSTDQELATRFLETIIRHVTIYK